VEPTLNNLAAFLLQTEVEDKACPVVWIADSGKTLPREYAFKIRTGNGEQTG